MTRLVDALLVFALLAAPGTGEAQPAAMPEPVKAEVTGGGEPHTGWMPLSEYQDLLTKKVDQDFYPTRVEGRASLEGPQFRAQFERRPPREFSFHHYVGIGEDSFKQRDQELSAQGYGLVWQHTFVDSVGHTRYQVTWVRDSGPAAGGARPSSLATPSVTTGSLPDALLARGTEAEANAQQFLKDGRYVEGIAKAREALILREQLHGGRHLSVAESMATLAEFHRFMGQYVEAQRLHRQALSIWEELLTSDHPQVAQSLTYLAILHNTQALYSDAEAMLLRALGILERLRETMLRNYGLQAEVFENLARVYRALGKAPEAIEAEAKAYLFWTLR
jgi:tetratricopeptide (TPR) repeat protein